MQTVWRSKAGYLFAYFTALIGNPLTPHQGKNIPMTVTLTPHKNENGVNWCRSYYFKNRKPINISSVKKISNGKMMECVGAGFGMLLDVTAKNGELHFTSSRYFCKIFGCYVPLPHLLSPGQTHVVHEDLGNHKFRFTITMKHKLLGSTFYQTGIFNDNQSDK
jgi:hypothetical protein